MIMKTREVGIARSRWDWKTLFSNPNGMLSLNDLDVYKLSMQLGEMCWEDYDLMPRKAQWTVGLQAIRAADSIAANISEGYGRYTPRDRRNFYVFARGSYVEFGTWLTKMKTRNLIPPGRGTSYDEIVSRLGPKLNSFINKTK
jgi:four helix bundle protein